MFRRKSANSAVAGRPPEGRTIAKRDIKKKPGEGGVLVVQFGLGIVIAAGMTMWMVAVAILLGVDARSYLSGLL